MIYNAFTNKCTNLKCNWRAKVQIRTEGEDRRMGERREVSETGATRETLYPKGPDFPMRFDLIFTNTEALQRLARTYGEGCQKYGPKNWQKGFPESVLISHALDHLQKWFQGSKEDDLAHAVWNLMTLMWVQENKPELLDLTGHLNVPDRALSDIPV